MLSRRNIRVKVMQTLYCIETMHHEMRPGEPAKILEQKLQLTRELITYLCRFLVDIALYAEKDALQKSRKHLPSESDLNVNTRIAGNPIIWQILENHSFKKSEADFKTAYRVDEYLIKECYKSLKTTEEYTNYTQDTTRNMRDERTILEYIFSLLMIENEAFINEIEGKFIHWDDDGDIAIIMVQAALQKPETFDFSKIADMDKYQFATDLLACVLDKNNFALDIIKPKLKNWDSDRIAIIDMILLKMGVCEMLYFETIPPKVSINEYIDLGKEYSTDQSGHFINGILDNIHKDLLSQNKIHKIQFKNSTFK